MGILKGENMYKRIRNIICTILSIPCLIIMIIIIPVFAIFALLNNHDLNGFIEETFNPSKLFIDYIIDNIKTGFNSNL
jgi:predicted PurR-regulated permease PerM